MEHKRPKYVHISTLYSRNTSMFICQTVNSDRFLETMFCTRSFRSLLRFGSVRFFEYAANSAVGERLRQRGAAKPRARRAKPVTLFLLNEI